MHNVVILTKSIFNKNHEFLLSTVLRKMFISVLYYNRIDVSEVIDVNNSSASKECIICHNWYFLKKGFRFQPTVCNDCHDILKMYIGLNSIFILNIHGE